MATFSIKGGKTLEGEIVVRGSKNSSLAALAASLLFENDVEYQNLPEIEDVARIKEILEKARLGELDFEIAKKLRASILLVGPMLARFRKVAFPHPGGCVIGARPIDVFADGWRAMGSKVEHIPAFGQFPSEHWMARADNLKGCDYTFRVPSVTGTEGLMMTAVLAKGRTILRNCAMEPEIVYLANFLNSNGASINGAGNHTVEINGRAGKLLKFKNMWITPADRIEAGSIAILASILGKNVLIKGFNPLEISALNMLLKDVGVDIISGTDFVQIRRPKKLTSVDLKTKEYPGFATDLQAPFTVLLTQTEGKGMVHETIFEGRLNYINDLNRMGAKIILCDPHRAIVEGRTPLRGRAMESTDLRAGLAFVIAALAAEGESTIGNIYQIDRGYEAIDERLCALGADIKRI